MGADGALDDVGKKYLKELNLDLVWNRILFFQSKGGIIIFY